MAHLEHLASGCGPACPATPAELRAIQRKLDAWEVQHLRDLALATHQQLEAAQERVAYLEGEVVAESCRADMFMGLNHELMGHADARVFITPTGQMGVIPADQPSTPLN